MTHEPTPDNLIDLPTSDGLRGDEPPVDVALAYVEGVLLGRISDAAERWAAVRELTDRLPTSLDRVRGLSIAQLVQEGLSVEDAGQAVGVTRAYAHALLTGEGQPTPRQLKTNPIENEPGYRLGVVIGVASIIAEKVDRQQKTASNKHHAQNQVEKIIHLAHQAPGGVVRKLNEQVMVWTSGRTRVDPVLIEELERANANLGEIPTFMGPVQQGHMWTAHGSTRVRLKNQLAGR